MRVSVFGLGYTGIRIYESLKSLPNFRLETFSATTKVEGTQAFDFSNQDSLSSFQNQFGKNVFDLGIVTFPIQKLSQRNRFLDILFSASKNLILLGTTSIYRRVPDITETTPLLTDHERFETEEEWLRRGGKLLRLCGIYGPGRNPADWARRGLVKKSSRQLNLIHGNDVAVAVCLLTEKIRKEGFVAIPNRLNLSDHQWHTWKEIFSFLEEHEKITKSEVVESGLEDCFIDSGTIRALLPDLQTKDFWTELENLEEISDH
ncbi:hypothetical protein AB3N59_06095 [Leptospira sp. WS92.C1]